MGEKTIINQVRKDFFDDKTFNSIKEDECNIDFWVCYKSDTLFQSINFLWAEAKKDKADLIESFVQLILTIGKNRIYENELPPLFLGAFDSEKIAFISYYAVMDIFNQNDFNWNVRPSDYNTKEFKQLYATNKELLESQKLQFSFKTDSKELQKFIKENFTLNNENIHKIQITKNNFNLIYQKWLLKVKDSISINWDTAKSAGILDADFYLADLLSSENQSLLDKLFVVLKKHKYEFNKKTTFMGSEQKDEAHFKDNQKAHTEFWNLYERPPRQEYWDYIIDRRDLLVPSDIRERKGAFFTPQIWVQKAQSYLEKALGEDWQSEYYVWDCAAGTGNLLANLTESQNLYASTLDKADVKIMQELAEKKHLSLLQNHIFQFDFLNDKFFDKPCEEHTCHSEVLAEESNKDSKRGIFAQQDNFKGFANPTCKDCRSSKLPKSLQKILQDEAKRKKLIIFINPPYAEASSYGEKGKSAVANRETIFDKYASKVGAEALSELFAQFFIRIYKEIPHCKLASFSTLKYLNSSNFVKFREAFKAKFLAGFLCPADTFDNVKGQFPIGFLVWDLDENNKEIGYNGAKQKEQK